MSRCLTRNLSQFLYKKSILMFYGVAASLLSRLSEDSSWRSFYYEYFIISLLEIIKNNI